MLVLKRRKNQSIIIDGNVKVTVLETHKGEIKIGIDAPKSVKVVRKELCRGDSNAVS